MSDVKRYDPTATYGRGHVIVAKRGDFVRHSDYAALEARLAEVERDRDEQSTLAAVRQARAERAETALATARRDALEEALYLMPRYYGCWSSTGVHIGVWEDGATAAKVLEEYPQGVMRELIDVEAIRALIAQEDVAN